MRFTLTTAPANEPVSLAEAKAQCFVSHSNHDSSFNGYIAAARELAEDITGERIITQTWTAWLDTWPYAPNEIRANRHAIWIRQNPVQSVSSVKYRDTTGTLQTLVEGTDYDVHITQSATRIVPTFGNVWPPIQEVANAIQIAAVFGYGDDETDTPPSYKQGMLTLIAAMYRNREDEITGTIVSQFRNSAERIFMRRRNPVI